MYAARLASREALMGGEPSFRVQGGQKNTGRSGGLVLILALATRILQAEHAPRPWISWTLAGGSPDERDAAVIPSDDLELQGRGRSTVVAVPYCAESSEKTIH